MDYTCRDRFKFIFDFDLFGKLPELYYKGKIKKVSWIGIFFTFIYLVLYIVIFLYKFIKMIKKEEVSFYETHAYTGFHSINLTKENFYGGFAMGDIPFIDETIYYPVVIYTKEKRVNGIVTPNSTIMEVERCQLNDFDYRYRDLFKDKPLNNLYCLKNFNVVLEGYLHSESISYFTVKFFKCINRTKNGEKCKTSEEIDKFLTANVFQFYIQNIDLTPQDYHSPIKIGQKMMTGPAFKYLYEHIYASMQMVIVETDEDFIGLNAFSRFKREKFLRYYDSWVISTPIISGTIDDGLPLCEITVQLADIVLTQRRTFPKLIEILGDVGGTMEFLYTIFSIIVSILSRDLYLVSLTNNLFSFDIDKKIIHIKDNKNKQLDYINLGKKDKEESKINDKNIKNTIPEQEKNNQIKFKKMNPNLLIRRSLKPYNRRDKKSKTSIVLNLSKTESFDKKLVQSNTKNEGANNIITMNEIDLNNKKNQKKENSQEIENKIINKIKINKFYFIICFICFHKRKNIDNILLNESERIIFEKLDILNILKRFYRDENSNIIEMSTQCKQKIYEYKNTLAKNSKKA